MNKKPPSVFHIQDIEDIDGKTLHYRRLLIFSDHMCTKLALFTTKKQLPAKCLKKFFDRFHYTARLSFHNKMQVLDRIKNRA